MDARLQRRVQRYGWDKAAAHYDRTWQSQLSPAHNALLRLAAPKRGEYVLDAACGTGAVTFGLAKSVGPSGRVLGTDISEEMVATARALAEDQGVSNVDFERKDAENLQLDEAQFDLVVCALGLMYCPSPEAALAEFHRVAKPGARVACAVWGQRANCGWAEIFPITDARVQSEVCPMFFRLGVGDALAGALSVAGFQNITYERFHTTLEYSSETDACDAAFRGGPVALAYDRFSEEVRADVHREYLASIADCRVGEGYAVPGEFVVSLATK